MVYVYHFTPHCSTHIKNPETCINTEKNKFQKIYRLLLTFTPAAVDTLLCYFKDTNTCPDDYDIILTGDLGYVGTNVFYELMQKNGTDIRCRHNDCGLMIYNREKQDVHSGGSGCGCSASILNSYIMHRLENGELNNILFMSTGALLSPTSSLQGKSIPGIAHLVNIKNPMQ